MNPKLLEIIACPNCQGKLDYDAEHDYLICNNEKTIFTINRGIPILLPESSKPVFVERGGK